MNRLKNKGNEKKFEKEEEEVAQAANSVRGCTSEWARGSGLAVELGGWSRLPLARRRQRGNPAFFYPGEVRSLQ